MHSVESTVEAATHLLATRFGGSPELTHPEDLGGSGAALVLRCKVAPNPFLQERTVVIKQLPQSGPGECEQLTPDELALLREVVAYQFTNTLGEQTRPGPLLLAYDIDQRILILSDAGDGENFTDVLTLRSREDRRQAVRKLGRALGRMHSTTVGGAEAYRTLMRRQCQKHGLNPATITDSDIDIAELIRQGVQLFHANGLVSDPTVEAYAEEAAQRQERSDLRAFTPFDLTPDNIMLTHQVVFLDYEWASFRDVAFDVACVLAGFPQDNTTPALNDEEAAEFLATWRAETSTVWPELKDDATLYAGIMAALIGWAFLSLMMLFYGRSADESVERNLAAQQQFAGRSLKELTSDQLEDLATTVDAIRRFAQRHEHPEFPAVDAFAHKLLRLLSRLGAKPQQPHE
ncbi:MAG TPA: aminoglycoside phosphotransferase family protein [Candidatus Corynebacterium gallistercoris]|uniref:Aminoglycoside phosphotransferase family protein n=1 Tax=Candidatus Corynebacterium gallistercoris TaxID=2838530 RepID=A0A9D1S1C1_9CORY|nr:aminoglycoside phosphotransferase family protein [Candidatus Corynebacterium gallistercoris]